jgi:hypothetical protein
MEKAIKLAIEGGWNGDSSRIAINGAGVGVHYNNNETVLDPLFWQCLGKAMGEDILPDKARVTMYQYDGVSKDPIEVKVAPMTVWRAQMHHFIDHLAEGKDAESFFNDLLK